MFIRLLTVDDKTIYVNVQDIRMFYLNDKHNYTNLVFQDGDWEHVKDTIDSILIQLDKIFG